MNHILHQNLLLEELKADLCRLQTHTEGTIDSIDAMLYINNHIQGLINAVNDMSARILQGKKYLSEAEAKELRDTQEMQGIVKKLVPLLYLAYNH